MEFSEIVRLGAKKYYQDGGAYRNPYELGTPEYNAFERGWTQSLKRDEGHLASESIRQTERLDERAKEKAAAGQDLAAELYRLRKG